MQGSIAANLVLGLSAFALAACSGADNSDEPAENAENPADPPPGLAAASSGPGKIQFLQCAACHAVEANSSAKVGPNLNCVIDRQVGAVEGFNYSQAFLDAAKSGLTWDREQLLAFIANPQGVIPGNAMAFGGIGNPAQAKQIVDYIEQECADVG